MPAPMPPGGGPPMPPGGGPPMPPGGGPPMPPGGGPSPADVAQAQAGAVQGELEALAATAPVPEEPYKGSDIEKLAKEVAGALDKLSEGQLKSDADKLAAWKAPDTKWNQPIPPEVYVPTAVLFKAAGAAGFGDKYSFEPSKLINSSGVLTCAATVKKMAGDKKLAEALAAGPGAGPEGGTPPEAPEAPPPGEYSVDEEEMMASA